MQCPDCGAVFRPGEAACPECGLEMLDTLTDDQIEDIEEILDLADELREGDDGA
jgi:predicted  nucleic acid-binding Zn-ribbon protein